MVQKLRYDALDVNNKLKHQGTKVNWSRSIDNWLAPANLLAGTDLVPAMKQGTEMFIRYIDCAQHQELDYTLTTLCTK
jgi:hypothetical protein